MTCQQCGRERELFAVTATDLTLLNGHVSTYQRGGRDRSYRLELCAECIGNLAGVPGGENVRIEPEVTTTPL